MDFFAPSTVLLIVIHSATLAIALYALHLARVASAKAPRSLRRQLESAELALADLAERHASLHDSHKKLNSRIAMREARAKKAEERGEALAGGTFEMLPGESESDWKRRCRHAIAEGRLKHEH